MSPPRESRPEDNGEALAEQPGGLRPMLPLDPRDEVARHVDGTFVVLVRTPTGHGGRRRCFLTVKAAEDAARKAIARGDSAVIVLAELRPLYRVIPAATS